MKETGIAWMAILSIVTLVVTLGIVHYVHAQTLTLSTSTTLAGCQAAAPPTKGALIHCNVANDSANPDGDYVSANGAAYFLVSKSVAAGVTSWNGASGTVTYTPTTVTCTTVSITNTGLTASGCTIK
jgi:hypothetical protein